MNQITQTDLVSAIVKLSSLSKEQLMQMVADFKKSYLYDHETHILRLIAQEHQVEYGRPHEYLYTIMKYEEDQFYLYFLPFTTNNKESIKKIIIQDIKSQFHKIKEIEAKEILTYVFHDWTFKETAPEKRCTTVNDQGDKLFACFTFIYKSEVIGFHLECGYEEKDCDCACLYPKGNQKCPQLKNITLEELMAQLRIEKVVQDYRMISANGTNYLPISLMPFYAHKEWETYIDAIAHHFHGYRYPYVSLEPFERNLKNKTRLYIVGRSVKQMTKYESLFPANRIEDINIGENKLLELNLPPTWHIPNLKRFAIKAPLTSLSIDFLNTASDLREVYICMTQIKKIDLTPLKHCPNLQTLDISRNRLTDLDLTPIQKCKALETLVLSENQLNRLDLTPLKHCPNLQTLDISRNRLTDLDLTPFMKNKKLRFLYIPKNQKNEIQKSKLGKKIPQINIKLV